MMTSALRIRCTLQARTSSTRRKEAFTTHCAYSVRRSRIVELYTEGAGRKCKWRRSFRNKLPVHPANGLSPWKPLPMRCEPFPRPSAITQVSILRELDYKIFDAKQLEWDMSGLPVMKAWKASSNKTTVGQLSLKPTAQSERPT